MKSLKPVTAEKYRQVVELRIAGVTFDEIANRVGYSNKSGAWHAYQAAMERYVIESVESQRAVQSERLDRLFYQAYVQARTGDLNAIDRCIRIEKRRAELWGLDAPQQHQLSGVDGAPIEIATDVGAIIRERLDRMAEPPALPASDEIDSPASR